MNILILSNLDRGGAGTAAVRLLRNLNSDKYSSRLLVSMKTTPEKNVVGMSTGFAGTKSVASVIGRKILHRLNSVLGIKESGNSDPRYCFFSSEKKTRIFTASQVVKRLQFKPDVIVVLFIDMYLTFDVVRELSERYRCPVVWYLMDMELLTGGCHYAWECRRYEDQCGKCPALYSGNDKDQSYNQLVEKQRWIHPMNFTAVAASQSLFAQCLQSSLLKGKPIHKILLPVDPERFKPAVIKPKKSFGIQEHERIIFIGASSLSEERKGMIFLLDALRRYNGMYAGQTDNLHLLIAGNAGHGFDLEVPFPYTHAGYLDNEDALIRAYQAADVFVCPSIEDSGPMMINEALMCGTPTVAFNVGVAPDLVITGKTGFLAKKKDSSALAEGIHSVLSLNDTGYKRMSDECRAHGVSLCHPQIQYQKFDAIFSNLGSHGTRGTSDYAK